MSPNTQTEGRVGKFEIFQYFLLYSNRGDSDVSDGRPDMENSAAPRRTAIAKRVVKMGDPPNYEYLILF